MSSTWILCFFYMCALLFVQIPDIFKIRITREHVTIPILHLVGSSRPAPSKTALSGQLNDSWNITSTSMTNVPGPDQQPFLANMVAPFHFSQSPRIFLSNPKACLFGRNYFTSSDPDHGIQGIYSDVYFPAYLVVKTRKCMHL